MSYILPFSWGLFVLGAFIGWGSLLNRLLFPENPVDWGQRAAWGVAFSILIGGLLNVSGLISSPLVISFILVGAAIFIHFSFSQFSFKKFRLPNDKIVLIGVALIAVVLALQYASWVISNRMDVRDDLQAYFVFPKKMLDAGSLGEDPFSERRAHAFGGHSFLQTLILCGTSFRSIFLIDPGLALIVLAALAWGFGRKIGLSGRRALIAPLLISLARYDWPTNTSSMYMGGVLFFALIRAFDREPPQTAGETVKQSFLTALIFSSLGALKAYFPVFGGVFLTVVYGWRFFSRSESKKQVILEMAITAGMIILFLAPWMWASYQAMGTFFYPLLGHGYHRSAYGFPDYEPLPSDRLWRLITEPFRWPALIGIAALFIVALIGEIKTRRRLALGIFFSIVVGLVVLNVLVSGRTRYWFPFFLCGAAVLLAMALNRDWKSRWWTAIVPFAALLPAGWALRVHFYPFPAAMWDLSMINFRLNLPVCPPDLTASYTRAQNAVPADETLLVRLSHPFVLDFGRNKIFNAEYLSLGPKPGLPLFEGGDAVADYLVSMGVRYAVYSYANEGGFKKATRNHRLTGGDQWLRTQTKFLLTFQDTLDELGRSRKRIYDDGITFVLDLTERI